MKKVLSLTIVFVMLLSMVSMLGLSVGAANELAKTYESAADGDVLYSALFNQTSGAYVPKLYSVGSQEVADKLKVEVTADGKSVTLTQGDKGARTFWGADVEGLTLGEGKKYTIEATVEFISNNAGLYITGGPLGTDIIAETLHNKQIGVYGNAKSGSIMIAGSKLSSKYICDGKSYMEWYKPAEGSLSGTGERKFTLVVDGYDLYAYVDGNFFDQSRITPAGAFDNLAICAYIYNAGATVKISDVVIKKGASLISTTTFPTEVRSAWTSAQVAWNNTNPADPAYQLNKSYADAAVGDKLLDIKFNSTSGVYAPVWVEKNQVDDANTSIESNLLKITNKDAAGGAAWYGATINGLKITDNTVYTLQFKLKCSGGAGYTGGVFFAAIDENNIVGNRNARMGVYGNFNDSANELTLKMGLNGGNHSGYAYADVAYPTKVTPLVDAEGFTEVRYVVDGYDYTLYVMDVSGEYKAVSTVNLSAKDYMGCDNFAFYTYVYNKSCSLTVKDAAVFKGDLFNLPAPLPTPTGDTTPALVALALISVISLAGVQVAKKAR